MSLVAGDRTRGQNGKSQQVNGNVAGSRHSVGRTATAHTQKGKQMKFYRWFYNPLLFIALGFMALNFTNANRLVANDFAPNAALKYWQAFSTMPKMENQLERKLKDACDEDRFGDPIDPELAKLINQSEYSLRMLHRGAEIHACDWGIDMRSDGAETILPHFQKTRWLAKLSLARARYYFEQNDRERGIADVLAAMTIARHIIDDGTLIGLMVGYSIETNAVKVLAAYLPTLGSEVLKDASIRFSQLPPLMPPESAFESEKLFLEWAVEQTEKQGEDRLQAFCETLATSKDQAAELRTAGGDQQQFVRYLKSLRPLYDEGTRLLASPRREFRRREKELADRIKENPIAKFVFPDVEAIYHANAIHSCHQLLLAAAIDIQINGKSRLQAHQDPYGDGPFELVSIANAKDSVGGLSYRLRSSLKQKGGGTIQLTVGRSAH
jgi:hypothetical protein